MTESGDREERPGEANNPGERKEEQDTHQHGQPEADEASLLLLPGRQFAREDGNENDVVDAENDFEDRQSQ